MKVLGLITLVTLVTAIPNPTPAPARPNGGHGLTKRAPESAPASLQPESDSSLHKRSPTPISPLHANCHGLHKCPPTRVSSRHHNRPHLHKRCGGLGCFDTCDFCCWNPCDWGCGCGWGCCGPWGCGLGGFGH